MRLKKQITLLLICCALLFSACGTDKENTAESNAEINSGGTIKMETEPSTAETTQPQEETGQSTETPPVVAEPQENTYITRESEINAVTLPVYQFDYPDGWTVISEEVATNSDGVDGLFAEKVVLSNDRGVTVTYMSFSRSNSMGYGRIMHQVHAEKVANSSFIPAMPAGTFEDYSYLGNFMVAKLKVVGELQMDTDSDYTRVDGSVYYAVVPESYEGLHDVVGMDGIYGQFRFKYPGACAFIAEAPGGRFTRTEEDEVVDILSSFRVIN